MINLSIIGVTGSIGVQTLDVIRNNRENFNLVAIAANSSIEKVLEIIKEFSPKYVSISEEASYKKLKSVVNEEDLGCEVLYGMEGLNVISTLPEVDTVVTSIVGMIGLEPTLNAIKAKKTIALANKETLVVGGELVMKLAKENGVNILPVDSEHSAIFQCLNGENKKEIKNIILTASGGPFRGKKRNDLVDITPEMALKHPKWNMGSKISIDSSTLMNKGLEVIEAKWLFDVNYENVKVVVHPQSIIHSMVEYNDGSVISQMGLPDMRLPIQYALNYPKRKNQIVESLDFFTCGPLTFEKPDMETFNCLSLSYEAGKIGGLMPTVLNGANEVCVDLFLNRKIKYLDIPKIIEESMNKFNKNEEVTLESILNKDREVREFIKRIYDK